MKYRMLSVAHSKWLVGSVLVVSLLAYCTFVEWRGLAAMHLLGYDYGFFYYAFHAVLHHQPASTLYQFTREQEFMAKLHFPLYIHNQYVYPPQFAVLLSPLGSLPLQASTMLWTAISITAYFLGIYWIASTLWRRLSAKKFAFIFLCAAMLTPFQVDAGVGNVNNLLFALIALTVYLIYKKQKFWLAGIPIGLAIVFKVTPAAALVYLILRKQWRTGVSAMVTVVITTGITAVRLGPGAIWGYVSHFVQFGQTSMKNGPAPYNQSLLGVLGVFVKYHWINLSPSAQQALFGMFAACVAGLVLVVVLRTHPNRDTDIIITSLVPLLFSPLVEEMHMVLVMPALIVLLHRLDTKLKEAKQRRSSAKGAWGLIAILAVSAILISLPVTFVLNSLVFRVPQLFWTQTNMFWVLAGLFTITVVLALHDNTRASHPRPQSVDFKGA